MYRARMLTFNIIVSVILAILASWVALFAVCQYAPYITLCRQSYGYPLVGGAAAGLVLMSFFWLQYDSTRALFKPRARPQPHMVSRYGLLERTADVIWRVKNMDDKTIQEQVLKDLEEYGWLIEFTDGSYLVVSQKEFYYWLLDVAKRQSQIEAIGRKFKDSPLSQRANPTLSRKRLTVYIKLLETVYAIEYLNTNVKRLKPAYTVDVWTTIIKPLERVRPLVRV